MRTTVDLPQDLHQALLSIASHTGRSLSQTAAELIRRGLAAPVAAAEPGPSGWRMDAGTGLPLVRSKRPVTPDDVRALDDEA